MVLSLGDLAGSLVWPPHWFRHRILHFKLLHLLCGMFGVVLGALGMLGTLTMGLTIDAFGPMSDNGAGIGEMSQLDEWVRKCTDILDAAGNTTAAIGKSFAISSAAL